MNDNIEQLRKVIEHLTKENKDLKQLLNQHGVEYPGHQHQIKRNHLPPQEKIKLYRSLFRGREDVYAVRWENTKTNKRGAIK